MPTKHERVLSLRRQGMKPEKISKETGYSTGYVRNILSKHGATRRHPRKNGDRMQVVRSLRVKAQELRNRAEQLDTLASQVDRIDELLKG